MFLQQTIKNHIHLLFTIYILHMFTRYRLQLTLKFQNFV